MTRILAIETSSAWCSVALSIDDSAPCVRHQLVSAGASQYLLPWIHDLLSDAQVRLVDLDAIAIDIGPGAFTGVRLGVAVVQGLATAGKLPIIAVASLDALAVQLIHHEHFIASGAHTFVIAIDARMNEAYWAKYQISPLGRAVRVGDIALSLPEQVDLNGIDYIAGSALPEFGERLFSRQDLKMNHSQMNGDITMHALGILESAREKWSHGLQQDVHLLEPLYIRNKVALTTQERLEQHHV